MFLNVDMMLLPRRGYRQGCHRSPSWTVLPIVTGIVLGSHRYILFVCFGPTSMGRPFLIYGPSQLGLILIFWTFFNGPSLLNLWPFSIGPYLNINVSIILQQG